MCDAASSSQGWIQGSRSLLSASSGTQQPGHVELRAAWLLPVPERTVQEGMSGAPGFPGLSCTTSPGIAG